MTKTEIAIVAACGLAALLAGCGKGAAPFVPPPAQLPSIVKAGHYDGRFESTPVVFGGRLLTVASIRPLVFTSNDVTAINVYDDVENLVASVTDSRFEFISAIVANGALYVFGTVGNASVQVITTADLVTWSAPVTVYTAPTNVHIYNTSVAPDPTGYVMAVETDEGVPFTPIFEHSADLANWALVGGPLHPEAYAGCPTVRYVNGYYYVFYLRERGGYFYTWAARSTDLTNWQDQTNADAVLSPEADEGVNASDLDFVEFNGQLHMVYLVGDQTSWSYARSATYNGTLDQLTSTLWN